MAKAVDPGYAKRRKAWRWGRGAEKLAVAALRCRGYRVLARQYRTKVGEIDLIARRKDVVVFIEVKARSSLPDGLVAISPRQQKRIVKAAGWFLQRHPHLANCSMRFDAIIIVPWRLPRHVRDAWRPEGID
ncbi:MAG: hypothetical protein CMM48_06855 [Rhodospirillaceae bacterium]|nr:hypothetical protein [Rhodospirillaceae bacterium]HAA93478.1 YraN family protein [Rhodospirillaceae bacterium]